MARWRTVHASSSSHANKQSSKREGAVLTQVKIDEISAGSRLGRIGNLEVRLARNEAEIAAAQEVRYRVFYDEMGARKDDLHALDRRDADRFDPVCDHLLVFDTSLVGPEHRRIVGTYRLLRQETAFAAGAFYSEDEFDIGHLIARHPGKRFLELGRSCVLPEYRSKRTIEALWQGIWAYINHYDVDVMIGCAAFSGVVPHAHAEALTYLNHHCRTAPDWHVRARADRYHPMNLMPIEAVDAKRAILAMPPLVKAYLRVGARFGDGCVIDDEFSTVDVYVVMPVAQIGARYVNYYGGESPRLAV